MRTSFVKTIGPAVLGVIVGSAVIVPFAGAAGPTTDARRCGADRNVVQAEFEIPEGRDIWRRFPALGITPELESDTQPARVVVFRGAYDLTGLAMGNGPTPTALNEVICVVQADGTVNVYSDVSRQGSGFAP